MVGRAVPRAVLDIGPWKGCSTVREKIALPPDMLGPDSKEWMVSPQTGWLVRRGGSTIQLDSVSSLTGALEGKFTTLGRAHQFVPLHIPSVADGYEHPAWVVCDETNKQGTLAWIDREVNSGAGGFNQLGKTDFNQTSSGHYRQDGSAGEVRMKAIPYVAEAGGIDYARFNSVTNRKYPLAGVRRLIENSRGILSPGAQACPYWWNKRRNVTATTGTERFRSRPWALDPAYWAPTSAMSANVAESASNWKGGNRFWEAWRFVFASGAKGPLFRISTTATTATKGGLVTVGTNGEFYLTRTISGIPLGPNDGPEGPCVAREGFRSLQATASEPRPDFSKMYGFMRIDDNTSTSAVDYFGSDGNLTTAADDLTNHTWPPRAQVAVAIENRTVMGGKIRFNPYALIIGPSGGGTSRDLNLSDENTTGLYGTVFYHVRIVNTGTAATSFLYLKRTSGGSTNTATFQFSTYTTLQLLCDAINETLFSDSYDEWFCQIVPPVDGNLSTLYLRATSDTGDEDDGTVNTAPADGTTLNVRAYCPTYYFAAAFTETYLATLPTDEQGIWLSDGNAGSEGSYSTFRVRLGDRKFPGSAAGRFVNIRPCTAAGGVCAIVFYERQKYALVNTKGGGSLDNADYVLRLIDGALGCISHLSCFDGPGYAGCVDQAGPWVGNGNIGSSSAFRPFKDHIEEFPAPGQLAGALSYGIKTDAALQAAGSDTYTWCDVVGDKLRVCVRSQAVAGSKTDVAIDYWFGASRFASGLESLLRDDGTPFGAACPSYARPCGVHGLVTVPSASVIGRRAYVWSDVQGSTGDGRVDEVDMALAADDNGTNFTSLGYSACILPEAFEEFGILATDAEWRNYGSALTVTIWGDVARAVALASLTLTSTGSNVMGRQVFEHPPDARGNNQCFEALISDDGTGGTDAVVQVHRIPTKIETKSAATRFSA